MAKHVYFRYNKKTEQAEQITFTSWHYDEATGQNRGLDLEERQTDTAELTREQQLELINKWNRYAKDYDYVYYLK